ncbi:DUF397 domain-containing protein [Streptomyces sp. NPDC006706]|uniref:DUF397 domain-containing protein n=1 Tax=Streptomyces sp. NPDC006706 TaxID=3364761 RepID=UPI0036A22888
MTEMASSGIDLSTAVWRKSSHSNGGGNCVEAADGLTAVVPLRDSKLSHGPVLTVTAPA